MVKRFSQNSGFEDSKAVELEVCGDMRDF